MEFVTRIWVLQIPPTNSGRNMNFLSCFNQTHHLWLMEFEMIALSQILVTIDVSKPTIKVLLVNKMKNYSSLKNNFLFQLLV